MACEQQEYRWNKNLKTYTYKHKHTNSSTNNTRNEQARYMGDTSENDKRISTNIYKLHSYSIHLTHTHTKAKVIHNSTHTPTKT